MSSVALTDLSVEFGKIVCVISLGYVCRRRNYISLKKHTLAQLLSKLILPTVFFYSTATMNLFQINFMIGLLGLLSRFVMMFIYYLIIQWIYPDVSKIEQFQYWSMSSLFVTMSYDIPIGFPMAKILWNPNESQYILTWAALSKIFIMSICIAILNHCRSMQSTSNEKMSHRSMLSTLINHFMTNPIIVGIFCGLSLNVFCCVFLQMDSIPQFIMEICIMIKNSYPFTALFIIGYGMCEANVSLFKMRNTRIIMLLVIGKCVVSPCVFYLCFRYIDTDEAVQNMTAIAVFYGMLPVAASPTVLSIQYKIYNEIMEMATIICLIVSMPMLVLFLFVINNEEIITNTTMCIPDIFFYSK
eukprot:128122_1